MKWVLAGVAFALVVGLAAFTAGIKAQNVAVRARIASLAQRISTLEVETARRAALGGTVGGTVGGQIETEELIERLRVLLESVRRSQQ